MPPTSNGVALKGSKRIPFKAASVVGEVAPNEPIEVTVVLHPSPQKVSEVKEINKIHPGKRKYLTHKGFERKHGMSQDDLDKVTNFRLTQLITYQHVQE